MNGKKVKRELKHLLKMRDTAITEGTPIRKEELPGIERTIADLRARCNHRDKDGNLLVYIMGDKIVCDCCRRILEIR